MDIFNLISVEMTLTYNHSSKVLLEIYYLIDVPKPCQIIVQVITVLYRNILFMSTLIFSIEKRT